LLLSDMIQIQMAPRGWVLLPYFRKVFLNEKNVSCYFSMGFNRHDFSVRRILYCSAEFIWSGHIDFIGRA
jgi:hypothetical protein